MKRTKPPFRADHVGSFLRPAALKDARAKREKGAITHADLKAIEDREIEKVVKKQEELGLQLATDGEFQPAFEGQGHRAKPICRIVDELKVVAI